MRLQLQPSLLLLVLLLLHRQHAQAAAAASHRASACTVVTAATSPTPLEELAAKEVRRYWYARVGRLPDAAKQLHKEAFGETVVVGTHGAIRQLFARAAGGPVPAAFLSRAAGPHGASPEAHTVQTVCLTPDHNLIVVTGATPKAVLYAAYTFAEQLGVRFMLHGDVLPAVNVTFQLPTNLSLSLTPSFALRGLQPFHDFVAGPDWWTADDHAVVLQQMTKMRMNFIGFHSYPFPGSKQQPHTFLPSQALPEPLIWLGNKTLVEKGSGKINPKGAYPTSWRTTNDNGWAMIPRLTSSYSSGASMLFPQDCYSSPAQRHLPGCVASPDNKTSQAAVIDGAAQLFSTAFKFGAALNITRAIGTELPLARPAGMSQQDAFEGAFTRLREAGIDIDYYWHWGGEVGHGYDDSAAGMAQFMEDVESSAKAKDNVGGEFKLATCGWELNGGFLDSHDPNQVLTALSTLDSGLGFSNTDETLQNVTQHQKWSIPWLEDDMGLIGIELWADRVMCHARKSSTLGVNGIMGIHWRTLGPSLTASALARVAWNLSATSTEVYTDFAISAFGPVVGPKAAVILEGLDSFTKPGTTDSCNGQGGSSHHPIGPTPTPRLPREGLICCGRWRADDGSGNPSRDQGAVPSPAAYAFADKFMALRTEISDPLQQAQFDTWAYQLQYHQRLAEVQRQLHRFEMTLAYVANISDSAVRKATARGNGVASLANFSRAYEQMMESLLSFATTQGELGMVAMQENMNYQAALIHTGALNKLTNLTAQPLPKAALPSHDYTGAPRLFVLTVRTLLQQSEPMLSIPIVALAPPRYALPATTTVSWRKLGTGPWKNASVARAAVDRGWYSGSLPNPGVDFEYFVELSLAGTKSAGAKTDAGNLALRYPVVGSVQVIIMRG